MSAELMYESSIYERLGGRAAIDVAVERFYERVLADQRVKHFFEGVDMERQIAKQKAFLALALGGPVAYRGRSLRTSHAKVVRRGLTDEHFDAVLEHLGATLKDIGAPSWLIADAVAVVECTRKDVLGRF